MEWLFGSLEGPEKHSLLAQERRRYLEARLFSGDATLKRQLAREPFGHPSCGPRTLAQLERLEHFSALEEPLRRHRCTLGVQRHQLRLPRWGGEPGAEEVRDLLPPSLRGLPFPEIPNDLWLAQANGALERLWQDVTWDRADDLLLEEILHQALLHQP